MSREMGGTPLKIRVSPFSLSKNEQNHFVQPKTPREIVTQILVTKTCSLTCEKVVSLGFSVAKSTQISGTTSLGFSVSKMTQNND